MTPFICTHFAGTSILMAWRSRFFIVLASFQILLNEMISLLAFSFPFAALLLRLHGGVATFLAFGFI